MLEVVVNVPVNRLLSVDTVHDQIKRMPEHFPSIDRCT
ncbi:hypothetical protein PAECIP111893_05004 [Paenibacillus plantiphilus]|uniref:Uncharacterized protein n=1 Tax=Paenibacillus plantiphilus TaxID=2905650 RepID=A0ABM9CT26_9BACL|nr:hypothetical protein PAECIP111893_05004 [Paenibacillus plantiphilus]